MKVIKQARDMACTAQALKRQGRSVGFVPTMGALHDGHLSLIREAKRQTRVAVVSLFVNPLQFGPQEDFEGYPRDLKRDLNLAKAAGADLVFAPAASQIYPPGFGTYVEVDGLSARLEGAHRPGHFRGVATVVLKLFQLVQPAIAYVGQKDYQQAVILQRMVRDLNCPVEIRVMPTVREPDGLAMSSRNVYLSPEERGQAPLISQALQAAKAAIRQGERRADRLDALMREVMGQGSRLTVQDIAVVHAASLEPVTTLTGRIAILLAVHAGATRLIDNLLVDVP